MTTEKTDGAILVTTGKFTQDTQAFAAGKPLELIEGNRLGALIRKANSGGSDLLDLEELVVWLRSSRYDLRPSLSVLSFHHGAMSREAERRLVLGLFDVPTMLGKAECAAGVAADVNSLVTLAS